MPKPTATTDQRIAGALERMAAAMERQAEMMEALTFVAYGKPRRGADGKLSQLLFNVYTEQN